MSRTASGAALAPMLRDAIARLNRRLRQTRPLGDLTQTQLSALTSLDLAGAMSPRELAEAERVQPPTMTGIVAKLEARGLVQRTPHPTDGRATLISVTDEGRRTALKASAVLNEEVFGRPGLTPPGWPTGWPDCPPPNGTPWPVPSRSSSG